MEFHLAPDDPSQKQWSTNESNEAAKRKISEILGLRIRRSLKNSDKVCAVCGDRAMGYNFDAVTCESCKAFFRRNALKDEDYHRCSFDNNCEITLATRRFCQKCRLVKCFKVGMKKEWIEDEDKLMQRKCKRIEKNKRKSSFNTVGLRARVFVPKKGVNGGRTDSGMSSSSSISGSSSSGQSGQRKRRRRNGSISGNSGESPGLDDETSLGIKSLKGPPRESVIRRLPSRTPPPVTLSIPTPQSSPSQTPQFSWPALARNSEIAFPSPDYITIRKTILTDLITACKLCCARGKLDLPPIVSYAQKLLHGAENA